MQRSSPFLPSHPRATAFGIFSARAVMQTRWQLM
jgi:hypothetical protein